MAGGVVTVSEHELSEIRGLIETRSGILFDDSRERFFSTRVVEHVESRKLTHGTDLLRLIKNSNVEYDSLLQRLLTQETSFFRYPEIFDALRQRVREQVGGASHEARVHATAIPFRHEKEHLARIAGVDEVPDFPPKSFRLADA